MKEMQNPIRPLFEKTSRAEDIYSYVKESILHGRWDPGERIDDLQLSKELGVSRISVREALSKLAENRILHRQHWKGFHVRELSWDEIESIIDVRMSMEHLALKKCLERMNPDILNKLEEVIDISERDLKADDRQAFFKSDFLFHEVIYEASGNSWVSHIIGQTKFFIDMLRLMDKEDQFTEVAQISVAEHREILHAIKAGTDKKALQLMKQQIERHKIRVREVFNR